MTLHSKLRGMVGAVCGLGMLAVSAASISLEQAERAVGRWLEEKPTLGLKVGTRVAGGRTCSPTNGATFHIVQLEGGGAVVVSSDTAREPVVAFMGDDDLVESDENPLWVLLKRDLAARTATSASATLQSVAAPPTTSTAAEAKWAKLLGTASLQGVSSVSDVRVAPFVQSKWSQKTCSSGNCYNYYTPSNYYCGCVATAGAQMMRYFEWPKSTVSIDPYTCKYCSVNGNQTTLTTQGGCYDWSQMPLVPGSSTTEAQRQMIGKLTSDIGIICGMGYTSGGSGTGGYMLQFAFQKFGYSNVMTYLQKTNIWDYADTQNAIMSNLDAKLPVMISIDGSSGGHAIVGDGYGYSDGTLYLHLNYGWGSATYNIWYAPPALSSGVYSFSALNGFVYNVYTNQTARSIICSGRVLDASGAPVPGAAVTAAYSTTTVSSTADANGIYALYLPTPPASTRPSWMPAPSYSYALTATYGSASVSDSVSATACTTMNLCPDSSSSYGSYYTSSSPSVGNIWGKDLVLSNVPTVETPVFTPDSCTFYPSTNVTISCATAGATIYYTTDGSEPTESSTEYAGPIAVAVDTTLTAKAFRSGYNASLSATATYTYDTTQDAPVGDYFASPIAISGESGTYVIADNSAYTLEEGEPDHTIDDEGYYYTQAKTIWYEWTAPKNGTVSFTTKCCKVTTSGNTTTTSRRPTWVAVYQGDDVQTATRLAYGSSIQSSDYSTTVSLEVEAGQDYRIVGMVGGDSYTGTFTLTWSGEYEEQTATTTTDVPVPYTWLDGYFSGTHSTDDYETIANADADGDGFATWQEYVLDTDPTDSTSAFAATIRMQGETPIVEWNHTNATIEALGYRYVPKGRVSLTEGAWSSSTNATHRFFKVCVEPR